MDIATAKAPFEVLVTVTDTLPGDGLPEVVVVVILPPPQPMETIDTTRGINILIFIMAANRVPKARDGFN